jgi:hypothetical protein
VKLLALAVLASWIATAASCRAQEAPDVSWAEALIPAEGGRLDLRRTAVEPIKGGVQVTCELTYPDIRGEPTKGQVNLFLPDRLRESTEAKLPLIHFAGYELDRGGGEGLVAKGVIGSTPHGEALNPIVRGENVDVAILHRVRALPFVDDAKVCLIGGSAGGYMALLLAAETFPVICCVPDVPPVNLGYNLAYFDHNKALAAAQPDGQDHVNMPVLNVVTPLDDQARTFYGDDHESDAYYMTSPLPRLSDITCPTLIVCSTADLLVPIDQMGGELAQPFDAAAFPDGFEIAPERLMRGPAGRRAFLDVVPPEQVEVFHVPVPDTAPKIGFDMQPGPGEPCELQMPFSRDRPFSLVVLDEGPPEPQCAHTKHVAGTNKDAFTAHWSGAPLAASQLTEAKLRRLMQRYAGEEAYPATVRHPERQEPFVANRLDFPEAERADVVRGLLTFAAEPTRAARLAQLYEALPAELKALGEDAAAGGADAMVERLKG